MSKPLRLAAFAAVLVVHFAAFAWLIGRYERLVTDGTECRFPCAAYDPADPFRGRYLRLNVEMPTPVPQEISTNYWRRGTWYRPCPLAVKIEPREDGTGLSRIVAVAEKPTDDGLWLRKCPVRPSYDEKGTAHVLLPNQYFLNENLAAEGERVLRVPDATNCVAVYRVRDGRIVLTGIEVAGRPIEDLIRERLNNNKKK